MTGRLVSVRPAAARPAATARLAGAALLALTLAACQDGSGISGPSARSIAPIAPQTLALMQTKGMQQSDPILIRAFKKEAEMEVWKRGGDGRYALLKTYPICRWSGQLGPKLRQGDRQAPEGFYTITPGLMNPNSSYYLSFDTGFPNAVDRANGRTGTYLMVHGTCSSAGCFAMTDASIAEIYAVAREAFVGGQRSFQFQSYPFRMTAQNMAKFRNDPNAPFWRNLKEGSDYFEALGQEPRIGVCGTRYAFGGADVAAGSCTPRVDPLVAEKRQRDEHEVAELVSKGTPAVRVVYQDGGQNPVFRPKDSTAFASLGGTETVLPYDAKEFGRHNLGEVSRPETLAAGPQEFEIEAKGRPTMLAGVQPAPRPGRAGPANGAAKPPAATLMASRAEPETTAAARPGEPAGPSETAKASEAARPPRIAVADADGDASAYQKLLGTLFRKDPAPATPAADAALAQEAAKPEAAKPEPIRPAQAKPAAVRAPVKTAHAALAPGAHETPARSAKAEPADAAKAVTVKPQPKAAPAKPDPARKTEAGTVKP